MGNHNGINFLLIKSQCVCLLSLFLGYIWGATVIVISNLNGRHSFIKIVMNGIGILDLVG